MGLNRRTNILSIRDQPKLIKAIVRKDYVMVKHLIANEEDVNKCDVERRCPLHLSASMGFTEIVKLLIESGARVNARDNEWISPLHRACRNNHEDVVSVLLEKGAEANTRDRCWITPMHVCAANNGLECAKVLLPHITSIDASDRLGATPLHHAVFNSHCDLITFLLTNRAQANAQDKSDRRPIHYASAVDSTDAIRFLVTRGGAEVNVHDKQLMTPLHIAAAKGSLNALHLLLDYGANIEAIDEGGNTAVHWAAVNGQEDIIEELILRGAQLNCANHNGITPLHCSSASTLGCSPLDLLLTHKDSLDMNARDKYGRTALHLAAKYGRHNRIPDLIRCGANCSLTDKGMATPLHYAAIAGHTPVVDILVNCPNVDVNILDTNGMSPLHFASFAGISSTCKRLLDANCNSQICDISGRTPHFMASYSGNLECLQMLMPLPEKLNDAFNRSLLHYASCGNSYECLNYLLNNYSQQFDINQRDLYGMTALHYASSNSEDDNRCVELLLGFGSKADIPDNNGYYPIHFAATTGMTSALQLLISAHNWKDVKMDVCPTHCAAFYGRQECLQLLLESNFQDIGPALEYAILKENNGCVKVILDFLKNVSNLKFSSHIINESILVASQFALHDTLNLLINYVQNLEFCDHRGRTPLMLASLNESGAQCVELLLKHSANPNAYDSQKRTALLYAIYSNVEESVKSLLNYGALPQIVSINGKTPFHIAAALGLSDILWTLLNFNNTYSPESLIDREGLTPLHWSALKAHPSCLNALLESATLKTFSGNKITPLHLAARSGSVTCFELLMSHFGKEALKLVDGKKRSVLHFGCMAKNNNTKIIDILILNGVDLDCIDIKGQTPLMYASKRGNIKVVEHLLCKGANVSIEDDKRNTALHHCCLNNQDECGVRILKKCHLLVSATNDDLRTPLHISASNGLVKLTQELLLCGASVNASDIDGMTPSLCCAKNGDVADCLMLIESIMLNEVEPRHSSIQCCDMESASSESRQSIIKRKSAQIFCDNTPNLSLNNISDHHNSSDSDFY